MGGEIGEEGECRRIDAAQARLAHPRPGRVGGEDERGDDGEE